MSAQAILTKYRTLLEEKAELQKRDLDLCVEIQVCEKEMELNAMSQGTGTCFARSESELFIEERRAEFEPEDLEFLEVAHCGTAAAVAYSGIPVSTLKRLVKSGEIEAGKGPSGNYQFKTVSLVRYLLDAKADTQT